MSAKLIYVIGPSGAGKDSVLNWVKATLPKNAGVAFARRTITRATRPGDEDHESLDNATFERLRATGKFAMDWQANGLMYGIRRTEFIFSGSNSVVIVNGSRAYLDVAVASYPGLRIAHITAQHETLKRRLTLRGRETAVQIDQRLLRPFIFQKDTGTKVTVIANDGPLEQAGSALLKLINNVTNGT